MTEWLDNAVFHGVMTILGVSFAVSLFATAVSVAHLLGH